MSDLDRSQNQPEPDPKGSVPLPRDEELENELQAVKEALEEPKPDRPIAPSELDNLEEVEVELGRESVRYRRKKTARLGEEVRNTGFTRMLVIAVLSLLALVALGSIAVIATGISTGVYPLAASGLATLSGSGGGGVLIGSIYMKSTHPKPEPEPTGEGP
jgi:hypothetical protein